MFCDKCGSILVPSTDGFACPKCGVKGADVELGEDSTGGKEVHMVKEVDDNLPVIEVECPKCEHGKAHYFIYQTRSADESPTTFYTCCKCGHKWRDYD